MDELVYDAVDLLKDMIAKPSISGNENEVADTIETFINKAGYNTNRSGNNIWCLSKEFSPSRPTILLNSHIDTVKPVDGWAYDPFSATEINETIYGLGSNDAGASVISLLAAFLYLQTKPQPYNMVFLASAEEEISGKNGIESVLPHLPEINMAVVGEPTDMQPAVAEKGLMVIDGVIKGISGHAARNEGLNAIYIALGIIETLKNLRFPKVSPLLGPVKITVTQIESGTQHNVIPDRCKIVIDVRTTEMYSNSEILDIMRNAVPRCELIPRSTRLNSSKIDITHPIIQRLITLGTVPFGSPTLSDQALMPFQSVKIGPGSSSRSHTANEFITIPEIRNAIQIYISVLDSLTI